MATRRRNRGGVHPLFRERGEFGSDPDPEGEIESMQSYEDERVAAARERFSGRFSEEVVEIDLDEPPERDWDNASTPLDALWHPPGRLDGPTGIESPPPPFLPGTPLVPADESPSTLLEDPLLAAEADVPPPDVAVPGAALPNPFDGPLLGPLDSEIDIKRSTSVLIDAELSFKPPTGAEISSLRGVVSPDMLMSAQRRIDNRVICNNIEHADRLRQMLGSMYTQEGPGFGLEVFSPIPTSNLSFQDQISKAVPVRKVNFVDISQHFPGSDVPYPYLNRVVTDLTEGYFRSDVAYSDLFPDQFVEVRTNTNKTTTILQPKTAGEFFPVGLSRMQISFDLAYFLGDVTLPGVGRVNVYEEYFKRLFVAQGNEQERANLPRVFAAPRLRFIKENWGAPSIRGDLIEEFGTSDAVYSAAVANLNDFLHNVIGLPRNVGSHMVPTPTGTERAWRYNPSPPTLFFDHVFSHERFLNEHLLFEAETNFGHFNEDYALSQQSPASRDTAFIYKFLPNAYSLYLSTGNLIVLAEDGSVPEFSRKNTFLTSIEDRLSFETSFRDTYYDQYSRKIKNLGTTEANGIGAAEDRRGLSLWRMNQIFFDSAQMPTIAQLEDEFERVIPFLNKLSLSNTNRTFPASPSTLQTFNNLSGQPVITDQFSKIDYNLFKVYNSLLDLFETGEISSDLADLRPFVSPQGSGGRYFEAGSPILQTKKPFTAFSEGQTRFLKRVNLLDLSKALTFYYGLESAKENNFFLYPTFNTLYDFSSRGRKIIPSLFDAGVDIKRKLNVEITDPKIESITTRQDSEESPDFSETTIFTLPRDPAFMDFEVLRKNLLSEISNQFINRTYFETLNNVLSDVQPLAYKIIKVKNGSTEPNQQQEIVIPYGRSQSDLFATTSSEEDFISYLDSQINFDTEFSYELRLMVSVNGLQYYYRNPIGRVMPVGEGTEEDKFTYQLSLDIVQSPSPKIIEVPLHRLAPGDRYFKKLRALDDPPMPPDVEFIPFKDVNNKVRFILNPVLSSAVEDPIMIEDRDVYTFERIRQSQGTEGDITFSGDSRPVGYQIFRLDQAPESYRDFEGTKRSIGTVLPRGDSLRGKDSVTAAFDDVIVPNRKYYYCFRSIDITGGVSNPTKVFEMELISVDAAILPRFKEYDFATVEKANEKKFRRYLKIKPSLLQEMIKTQDLVNEDGSVKTSADLNRIPFIGDGDSTFYKKFKAEIISKKTGRKIFIDFKFTKDLELETIRRSGTLDIADGGE